MELESTRIAELAPVIRAITTDNDPFMGINRIRVKLTNGWEVSVITGGPLHGGNADGVLFEIAPISPEGELIDVKVQGYLTNERVIEKIFEVSKYSPTKPITQSFH